MKNRMAGVVAVMIVTALPLGASAATPVLVTGTIVSVDAAKNQLKLNRIDEKGRPKQVTLKWKESMLGADALEHAQVGSQITVEANDSIGAWEVIRVNGGEVQTRASSTTTTTTSTSRQVESPRGY